MISGSSNSPQVLFEDNLSKAQHQVPGRKCGLADLWNQIAPVNVLQQLGVYILRMQTQENVILLLTTQVPGQMLNEKGMTASWSRGP